MRKNHYDLRKNSDEQLLEAAALWKEHGTARAAAEAAGVGHSVIVRRVQRAAERGLLGFDPVLPGFSIRSISTSTNGKNEIKGRTIRQGKEAGDVFEVPKGLVLDRLTANTDSEGRIKQQWPKYKAGVIDPEALVDLVKTAFQDVTPAPISETPNRPFEDISTVVPCNDWHLGLYVGKDWDLSKAIQTIETAIRYVIAHAPASDELVILGGGDLLHADNKTNMTARSGNILDVFGRYSDIVQAAQMLKVRLIDYALTLHKRVKVVLLRGNHDEHTSLTISGHLAAWYRNEPRVDVDSSWPVYWWYRFGTTLIGSTHGHDIKLEDMPGIMAVRARKDWGESEHQYIHTFHVHHKRSFDKMECFCESHQAPIPPDDWHVSKGYFARASVQAISYGREGGEFARTIRNLRHKA